MSSVDNGLIVVQVYRVLKTRNNNKGLPEFRLPMLGSCAVLVPPGLLIYGVREFSTAFLTNPSNQVC